MVSLPLGGTTTANKPQNLDTQNWRGKSPSNMGNEEPLIPIINLKPLNLPSDLENVDATKDLSAHDPVVRTLASELIKAFTDIGFCYLVNHAVSDEKIEAFNEKTGKFFNLPTETKAKYGNRDAKDANGWQGPLEERLDPSKGPDFKQVYNIIPVTAKKWPEEEIPGFQSAVMDLFQITSRLCHVVLKLMGIGLELQDPNYFVRMNSILSRPNGTAIRAALYPPVPKDIGQRPGVLRCGEHTDYGSVTLLYQDNIGGLEVMNRAGQYVPATPVEGSVVVNIADMMQRWTADRLISTKHRVVIPKEDYEVQRTRRSIAFFANPDDEAVIRCIDNSEKYPPINPHEYIVQKNEVAKFRETK